MANFLAVGQSPARWRVTSYGLGSARGRLVVCAILVAATFGGAGTVAPGRGSAAPLAAPVVFPGPSIGVIGTQTPTGTDFARHCNSYLTTSAKQIGGTLVVTGTATENSGCAQAVLYLNRPNGGRLHASVGVSDDETRSTPMLDLCWCACAWWTPAGTPRVAWTSR